MCIYIYNFLLFFCINIFLGVSMYVFFIIMFFIYYFYFIYEYRPRKDLGWNS